MKVTALALAIPFFVIASNIDTELISFEVEAINAISISGTPPTLTIDTGINGQMQSDTDTSTTYGILSNTTGTKTIDASISPALASGITLKLLLEAPTGGDASEITLSTSDQEAASVSGLINETDLTIQLEASVTPTVAIDSYQTTLTLTLSAS